MLTFVDLEQQLISANRGMNWRKEQIGSGGRGRGES